MISVVDSVIPVFLLIAAGWLARVCGLIEDKHWSGIELATYYIFFPAIIIDTLARADLGSVPVLGVGGALVGAILLIAGALLALRPFLERSLGLDGPSFTSLFQGSTRWNTFIGLAMATTLFGPRGVTLMAVAIAAMVPLLNTLAFYVLVRYAGGPPQTPLQTLRSFVTNPYIWSCAIGLALNVTGLPVPKPVGSFIEILGRAALAAGLLIVGAGLDVRRLAKPEAAHLISIAAKLFVLPVVAVTLARLAGVGGLDLDVTIVAASVPTASGAYALAKLMGGNAALMAEIITIQTLASLATMPLMIALFGTL
jgi:malonate transporter and related proteins